MFNDFDLLESEANFEFGEFLSTLFMGYPGDVKVYYVALHRDPFKPNADSYSTKFNTSKIVENYVADWNTPTIYQLLNNGYAEVSPNSNITVEFDGKDNYYTGSTSIKVYDDCPYDVNYDDIKKECAVVDSTLIEILEDHKSGILDVVYPYAIPHF